MTTLDTETQAQRDDLKKALWYHVGQIVDEECINLGVNATPQFIGSLAELVWTQIESIAIDLESFSNHANRKTIKTDDVLLLGRRNDGLQGILKDCVEKIEKRNSLENGNGKGKNKT